MDTHKTHRGRVAHLRGTNATKKNGSTNTGCRYRMNIIVL
jgi:hypothetical protein